jgi:hypothetical protein
MANTSRHPWWAVVVFLIGCGLVFWFSGGVTPAY